MDIIHEIKRVAAEKKVSLAEIGRRLDMSQQSLSQMLKKESIKFSTVLRIAEALDVDFCEFIPGFHPSENMPLSEINELVFSQQRTIENLSKCLVELQNFKDIK